MPLLPVEGLNGPAGRLFLIGYRGTGKTTVGRILANRLGWGFIDADDRVEAAAGRTIAEIFATEGEPGFRDRESAALAELTTVTRHVVATGGGVIHRPTNRAILRSGFVVWLVATPEAAFDRLRSDATTAARRPNLTPKGGLDEVRALIAAREPLYRECADCVIDTEGQSPDAVASAILLAWNGGSTSQSCSGPASPSSSG